MAVYATAQDVRSALIRDDRVELGSAATLTDYKIEREIANASAQVDAVLAQRYIVPFTDPVPSLIHQVVVDMAVYLSDLLYRQETDFSSPFDPYYLRMQRAAVDILEKLRAGDLNLPDTDPDHPITQVGAATSVNKYTGDLFTLQDFDLVTCRLARPWGWF
jgi:phage gp36-like protein